MKIVLILLAFIGFFGSAHAYELEIISLKHRSAEELLPVIQPLLGKDEMASGMNNQLILRASPHNTAQIKRLLDRIDTAPRRLKITVMQDVDSETVARLAGVSGSPGRGSLNAHIISTRQLEDDHKTQQLQVLEGSRARVSTGQTVAMPQRQVVQTPWGAQVVETAQYREVASGFYVLPRVQGDNVTLEISTQNDSLAPNVSPAIRVQHAASTVSGHLGEWMTLGGVSQQVESDGSTLTTRSRSHTDEQRAVLIKVEAVE